MTDSLPDDRALSDFVLLSSAYGNEVSMTDSLPGEVKFFFTLPSSSLTLTVLLPVGYPTTSRLVLQSVAGCSQNLAKRIRLAVEAVASESYDDGDGIECSFQVVQAAIEASNSIVILDPNPPITSKTPLKNLDWLSGGTVLNTKSIFQGHAVQLVNLDLTSNLNSQVAQIVSDFTTDNPNISRATHNMFAWRCSSNEGCCDDGESAAGKLLGELLRKRGINNTLLIVSRWSGGIKLGSARFRNISEAGNDVLCQFLASFSFVHPDSNSNSCKLEVKVVPNSQAQSFKVTKDELLIYLTKVPHANQANIELLKYLSKILSTPKAKLTIIKGSTSRSKIILVEMASAEVVVSKFLNLKL